MYPKQIHTHIHIHTTVDSPPLTLTRTQIKQDSIQRKKRQEDFQNMLKVRELEELRQKHHHQQAYKHTPKHSVGKIIQLVPAAHTAPPLTGEYLQT